MLKTFLGILTGIFILSCGQAKDHSESKTSAVLTDSIPSKLTSHKDSTIERTDPIDSVLTYYLEHSNNDLVNLARKDKIVEEALFDTMERTDTANYYVFQIGHDLTDNNGKRFITDSWVYIDSVKRKIYEYDLAKDRLIEWKKH